MHSLQIKTGEVWVSDYFWKFWLFWKPDCQVVSHHCTGDQPNKSMICSFLGSALASIESQRQSLLSVRLPNWLPPGRRATILLQRLLLGCAAGNYLAATSFTAKYQLASCLLQAPACCQECWQEAQLSICTQCSCIPHAFVTESSEEVQLSIWPVQCTVWTAHVHVSVCVQCSCHAQTSFCMLTVRESRSSKVEWYVWHQSCFSSCIATWGANKIEKAKFQR